MVCGAAGAPLGYAGLRRCGSCTHAWADVAIGSAALADLYQRSYFFGDEYSNYLEDRRVIEKNFARRLGTLRRFLTARHRRLFELGAAYGFFLNLARDCFDRVDGIDVSADAVRFANEELRLSVTCGDLLDTIQPEGAVDVACLWDTIEHLGTPRPYIERLASRMAPGALLALTTGDIGSLNARLQGPRWRLIHPPTHLHYFTQRSMRELLGRCGFRVAHVEYPGVVRNVSSMIHNLVDRHWQRPRAASRLRSIVPSRLDLYVNLYDIMYIIAERQ
jgi:SAM-dependent methyltransferase